MRPASEEESVPTKEKILDCYAWGAGSCFRCAQAGVDTTRIGRVLPRSGESHEVRACRECVLVLEDETRRIAERRGDVYQPGCLGKPEP